MKKLIFLLFICLLSSCNKDQKMLDVLNTYNFSMESEGYHLGDVIKFPDEVTSNIESISMTNRNKETNSLKIDSNYFDMGKNDVTFKIISKKGKTFYVDATLNVFAKNNEKLIKYVIENTYPHKTNNFTEGFYFEDDNIYESVGLEKKSSLMKYTLGSTINIAEVKQADSVFSEGIAILKNKVYQLTYKNRIGFIYDKNSLKTIGKFKFPDQIKEGWGMTTDGNYLIVSDGTSYIYFLNPGNPSEVVKYICVAGYNQIYDQLNELEYHNGFLYSNIWHDSSILKINPKSGEVVGKLNISDITNRNPLDEDKENVLNGIAFKKDNMLITGKRWSNIYELKLINSK